MHGYRVTEFAKLAGVTVRTLHYYDQIGLLKPSGVTDSGHRLYRNQDLLSLQQILTLKWMGFPLQEIKAIIESPTYNLQKSLMLQKAAIDAQIASLQKASDALAQALDLTEQITSDELDADTIAVVIHAVTPDKDWARQYYSDTAMARIQARGFSPEELARATRDWADVYKGFRRYRRYAPDSPEVQALAARMVALVQAFTGGDPEIEAGLRRMYANPDNIPPAYRMGDPDLQPFIQQALNIYLERMTPIQLDIR